MASNGEVGRGGQRLTTGDPGLDEILGGGIPRGSVVFVTGLPGAGKTILCEQALFANARRVASTVYATTLSEPAIKTLHFSQDFRFFQPGLLERSVHYADLGSSLRSGGPAAMIGQLDTLIRDLRPDFLVIDSFKVLREHFDDVKAFRAFASDLVIMLTAWEITTLLVGEYRFDDIPIQPEFAIADGIIHLSGTDESNRQKRFMNIVKMRGANAFLGQHFFDISAEGLTVYPRLVPRVIGEYARSTTRVGSAIPGINEMLSGGVFEASVLLISGGSGTGKTLSAMAFAIEAARNGKRSLFVSFEESPEQLARNCEQFGWQLADFIASGMIEVMHVSPSELDIDRHALLIQRRAKERGAAMIVVDSITAFESGLRDVGRLQDYLWGIGDYFKRVGVTLILTTEAYSFYETGESLQKHISYISDCIVLLRLVEVEDEIHRRISVLKMRGSAHDSSIREFRIAAHEIAVISGNGAGIRG